MDSKQYFVKQVAETIRDNHAKHDDSFIFGISGKWGEGKTTFLNGLKIELENGDSKFKVYKINPWKYSSDKTSFLRNFLKVIYHKPDDLETRIKNVLNDAGSIENLDADTSQNRIHYGWLLTITLWIGFFGLLYYFVQTNAIPVSVADKVFLYKFRWIATLLLLPVFVSVLGKVLLSQKTNHAISTLDKFDTLLDETLVELRKKEEHPVVFVDDLDRVTPEVARDVLDNLRTFFDKPDLTFVVTGDHTVLERYLGNDLLPDSGLPEQVEEGRRFLKKIFNVYWRLPQPIERELDEFLSKQFTDRKLQLEAIFTTPTDQEVFKSYLKKYFDKNYRQIIRFIDSVLFTFQIIQKKLASVSEEEKKYLKELPENPLLVIRILAIQELCAPLFDLMLQDYQLLIDLEYAVDKKSTAKINELIDPHKEEMSPFQNNFIRRFLYEEPRFFKNTSLEVSDIRPFLFLAADASFGDSRGPSGDDFLTILNTGDPAQVKNALVSISESKAADAAQAFTPTYTSAAGEGAVNILKTILTALVELPAEYPVHKIFAERLKALDYAPINNHASQVEKMTVLKLFWSWLDMLSDTDSDQFIGKFPYSGIVDFDPIDPSIAGHFTARMLANWLVAYFPQNDLDALSKMNSVFEKIPKEQLDAVKVEVSSIVDRVTGNIIADSAPASRETRFSFVHKYTSDGVVSLKAKAIEQIKALNADIYQWASFQAKQGIWDQQDLDAVVLSRLESATDFNSTHEVLNFIANSGVSNNVEVWKKISHDQINMLVENLSTIMDRSFEHIAPPEDKAQELMEKLIEAIKSGDDNRKLQLAPALRKEKWLWKNLPKKPAKNRFASITQSENEPLKNTLTDSLSTWEDKK